MEASRFYVITGGTMVHVAPHFSICAPAYGAVGAQIRHHLRKLLRSPAQQEWDKANEFEDLHEFAEQLDTGPDPVHDGFDVVLVRTKMARGSDAFSDKEKTLFDEVGIPYLETNEDLEKLIDYLVLQPETKGIVLAAAVCDWQPEQLELRAPEQNVREARLQADYDTDSPYGYMVNAFGKKEPRLSTSEDSPKSSRERRV